MDIYIGHRKKERLENYVKQVTRNEDGNSITSQPPRKGKIPLLCMKFDVASANCVHRIRYQLQRPIRQNEAVKSER